jgi:chromosomal replication initiation ATPase DnaA
MREIPYKGVSPDMLVFLASEHRKSRRPPTLREIFDEILFLFDVREEDILSVRQNRDRVIYRQLFSYVATQLTKQSLERIGQFLGGYDHTTILSHKRKVSFWIENDDDTFRPIWNYYRIESKLWRG